MNIAPLPTTPTPPSQPLNWTQTRLSVFRGVSPTPVQENGLDRILEWIRTNDKLREQVSIIRAAVANQKSAKDIDHLKKQLPGVTFGGTFSYRNRQGLITRSGLVVLDFDKVSGAVETRKRMAFEDEHVLAAWISPSGNGIKLLVEFYAYVHEGMYIDENEYHKQCFQSAVEHFSRRDSLIADHAAADWTRLSYLSFDENLLVKPADFVPVAFMPLDPADPNNDIAPTPTAQPAKSRPSKSKKSSQPKSLSELDEVRPVVNLGWDANSCPNLEAVLPGLPIHAEIVCQGWLAANSTDCLRDHSPPHGPPKKLIGPGARDHLVSRFAHHVGERYDADIAGPAVEAFVTDCILSVDGDEYEAEEVAKHKRIAKNKARAAIPTLLSGAAAGAVAAINPRVSMRPPKGKSLLDEARRESHKPENNDPIAILSSFVDGKTPYSEREIADALMVSHFSYKGGETKLLLTYGEVTYRFINTQWIRIHGSDGVLAEVMEALGPYGYPNRIMEGVAKCIKMKLLYDGSHYGHPRPPCRMDRPDYRMSQILSFTNRLEFVSFKGSPEYSEACSPHFFSPFSIPHPYSSKNVCPQWLKFLDNVFNGDQERIALLQEWFGYCCMPTNHLQKMCLLVGPRRSGKGTTATVLQRMLGSDLATQILSDSLSSDFILQSFIGKLAVVIDDVNEGGSKNALTSAIDMLKSITGSDTIQTNRKNKEYAQFDIACRFTFTTNSMPRMPDNSGALRSRFLVLLYDNDNTGKEDVGLLDSLTAEIEGILAWSIVGLRRLLANNQFSATPTTEKRIDDLLITSTPVAAFAKEHLLPADTVDFVYLNELYAAFLHWSGENGYRASMSKSLFVHSLVSLQGLKAVSGKDHLMRPIFFGIKLVNTDGVP